MYDAVSVLVFYLGIAEIALSGYLLWIAYKAVRDGKGKSFYLTLRVLLAAVLLFTTVQVIRGLRLLPDDSLRVADAFSSIMLILLLISAVREIMKGMGAHEHLVKHRRHGKHDVE